MYRSSEHASPYYGDMWVAMCAQSIIPTALGQAWRANGEPVPYNEHGALARPSFTLLVKQRKMDKW